MMTRQEILDKIITIACECVPELEGTALEEETAIDAELGVDSMSFIFVICKIESELNVHIPHRQWKQLTTLGEVVDAVERYLENG